MDEKRPGKPVSVYIGICALILMILFVLIMMGGVIYWWSTRKLSTNDIWYVLFPLIMLLLVFTSMLISLVIFDYRVWLYIEQAPPQAKSIKELREVLKLFDAPKLSPLLNVLESIVALVEKWLDGKNKSNSP